MGRKKLRIYFHAIFLLSFLESFGQITISGKVYATDCLKLQQASVVLTDTTKSNILAYTFSDTEGTYKLETKRSGKFILKFSHLGYSTKIINLEIATNTNEKIINAFLREKTTDLDEVIIQAEQPFSIKKDTINVKTKYFVDGTEQTVEDLLKRIPGLQIDSEGTIRLGNQEIEKLMIEGDDFFEKGYKVLSKNMPAYPIEEVEILKNYSNNRLLKGVEESNKVALNLKLDEKSKRIWFGNVETSIGNDTFYQVKGNLMNFGKRNKYYFFTNLNNTGYDATGDINNLIKPYRFNEPGSVGDNQSVNTLLDLSPNQLNFKQDRTNFNNAKLVSLNAIFNPTDKLKLKTLSFFNLDETKFFRKGVEEVNVSDTNFTNTEDYDLHNKKQIAFGKLDFIYNISKDKILEAATKYSNGDFDIDSNLLFNGNSTKENLQHQNVLFDQIVSYSIKFNNKKVFLLTGRFIDEKAPQYYMLNQFFYQALFPNSVNANNVSQESTDQMQFVGINAHLLNRKGNGHLLEFQFGNEYRIDRLKTTFSLLEDETILGQPDRYQNQTIYQVNDFYFKSKYHFRISDIGLTGKLDFHQLFNKLDNNQISSNQNPIFLNPSIGFDWKINERNKVIFSYSYNTSNAKIQDVFSDFVLTGFRSFSKGTSSFNQLDVSSLMFNYQLGNWSNRFFANTFLLYSKNHDFFSTNSLIDQNFTQTEKILIKDREIVSFNSKLDYFFKFISSNLKLDLGYSESEFKNIVNNSKLRQVKSNNYNYGLEIRSGFKGVFNYHFGVKWSTTEIKTTVKKSFTDNISFLDLSFVFNDNFDVQLQAERYYFGNLGIDRIYCFLDCVASYKLIEKKLMLGLSGKNLLNTEKFRNFSISDIGSSTTEYRLLPRFLLLNMEYRF